MDTSLTNPASPDTSGPVTLIFKRRVRRGRQAEFEAWISGVTRAALGFPGHLGAAIIRPTPAAPAEYAIVFRFDSYTHARGWEDSEIRAGWVEQARPLTEGEAEIQRVTGLEFWFTPPAGAAPPPRWKMALVSFGVLWPLNVFVNTGLGWLIGGWPIPLRALVVVGILVPVTTYIAMPWATRLLSGWLYPKLEVGGGR